MEKYTIKETKEFGLFLNAIVKAVKSFKASGQKFSFKALLNRIGDFLPAIGLAENAFDGIELIPQEWSDLSKAEALEIIAIFNDGLEPQDQLKESEIEELFAASVNFFIAVRNLIQKDETPV